MHTFIGEVVEILEEGERRAKVKVGRAFVKVSVELLPEVKVGDKILLCAGVALGKISAEVEDVPRSARESPQH
ncbi:MAG: HypC/HybG/HupF family hydrogenase formation chaperone [Anaerolineae bacterium]|nr:HypC/HybG/HupF family hydrogenase formation chaperone [Anaerolineae bacterium]MDW8103010.1 HypC/HybG/HupF family hydrogenase formation chaperone [Anaerolineae bacterium]